MSWRRFCTLYAALSPRSQVYLQYDRIAKKEGVNNAAAEKSAWDALTGLAKPRT